MFNWENTVKEYVKWNIKHLLSRLNSILLWFRFWSHRFFFVQKNKKFPFPPCIFPSEPFVIWGQINKIHFLFVKSPLYVLIYEEQIIFALKESGLIQEQRKNEKRKEKFCLLYTSIKHSARLWQIVWLMQIIMVFVVW